MRKGRRCLNGGIITVTSVVTVFPFGPDLAPRPVRVDARDSSPSGALSDGSGTHHFADFYSPFVSDESAFLEL